MAAPAKAAASVTEHRRGPRSLPLVVAWERSEPLGRRPAPFLHRGFRWAISIPPCKAASCRRTRSAIRPPSILGCRLATVYRLMSDDIALVAKLPAVRWFPRRTSGAVVKRAKPEGKGKGPAGRQSEWVADLVKNRRKTLEKAGLAEWLQPPT